MKILDENSLKVNLLSLSFPCIKIHVWYINFQKSLNYDILLNILFAYYLKNAIFINIFLEEVKVKIYFILLIINEFVLSLSKYKIKKGNNFEKLYDFDEAILIIGK